MRHLWVILLVIPMATLACDGGASAPPTGTRLAIDIAALSLEGVGDVVWDIEVVNGRAPTPDVVWQRRLSSTAYGDGAGSASYVGACDADPTVRENTVRVWVVGVYDAPVASLGTFSAGALGGAAGSALDFENPTAAGPLTQTVTCREDADAEVRFDVALMRPARQGFFDVAVNFDDVFCSAKLDCCVDSDDSGTCATNGSEDTRLLFTSAGVRGSTMVLGLACTAGPGSDVDTLLYLDPLELDCTAPASDDFDADISVTPSGPSGNRCAPGDDGMSSCTDVVSEAGVDADDYLFQVAVYQGVETLTSGAQPAQKAYWNVALGVKRPAIGGCWFRTRASASDANHTQIVDDKTIAAGAIYPYIQWDAELASCTSESLSFGSSDAFVRTEYTATDDAATPFAFAFGASLLPCGLLGAPCPTGYVCDADDAVGTSYTAFCESTTRGRVWIPAGSFWMGCNSAIDSACNATRETPQHLVELAAFAIDRAPVTAGDYYAWCPTDRDVTVGAWTGTCIPNGYEGNQTAATYPLDGAGVKQAHPINYVNAYQASAYCADHGGRLCTEAEWERAARGGCETVGTPCQTATRVYPWGATAPTCTNGLANIGHCVDGTTPAGDPAYHAGTSPYGARDMGGNISSWVDGWLVSYSGTGFDYTDTYQAYRGGAWSGAFGDARASFRNGTAPSTGNHRLGIRCCYAP